MFCCFPKRIHGLCVLYIAMDNQCNGNNASASTAKHATSLLVAVSATIMRHCNIKHSLRVYLSLRLDIMFFFLNVLLRLALSTGAYHTAVKTVCLSGFHNLQQKIISYFSHLLVYVHLRVHVKLWVCLCEHFTGSEPDRQMKGLLW